MVNASQSIKFELLRHTDEMLESTTNIQTRVDEASDLKRTGRSKETSQERYHHCELRSYEEKRVSNDPQIMAKKEPKYFTVYNS